VRGEAGQPGGERIRPSIEVVGLGPGPVELLTVETAARLREAEHVFLRTSRHPAAAVFPDAPTFDHLYEEKASFDEVYETVVEELLAAARRHHRILYAVPGAPSVAERTVELLRQSPSVRSGAVDLVVRPALSFLDVAFDRLGVDPVGVGARLVDGPSFAVDAAGSRGPLPVAQCWDRSVLSTIKLAPEVTPSRPVTVLQHLALPDERIWQVAWEDLDRVVVPDHLTSLWIPELDAPVAGELVRLEELVRVLRQRCPWDRRQTHGSLRRHLLEECYEVLEALDEVAAFEPVAAGPEAGGAGTEPGGAGTEPVGAGTEPVGAGAGPGAGSEPGAGCAADAAHPDRLDGALDALEEELGDLLFQVYLHSRLAAESGRFTLADVARGVHDKLVDRHPHVFGDEDATTAELLGERWERRKLTEKQRSTVTEGVPETMPALALAAKLQQKAGAAGMVLPGLAAEAARAASLVAGLAELPPETAAPSSARGGPLAGGGGDDRRSVGVLTEGAVGEALFAVASVARSLGVDPESALRARLSGFRAEVDLAGHSRTGAPRKSEPGERGRRP